MQAVGAIDKSGKAGEIDRSRRQRRYYYSAYQRTVYAPIPYFLSLLLLTSSLSNSAETLGLETSLALPALFATRVVVMCTCELHAQEGLGPCASCQGPSPGVNSRVECARVRKYSRCVRVCAPTNSRVTCSRVLCNLHVICTV